MREDIKTFYGGDAEQIEFRSRIFLEGRWHDVSFADGCSVESYPQLFIQWHAETLDNWTVLRATLENRGDEPISLGAFHMLEGAGISSFSPDDVIYMDTGFGVAGAMRINAASPEYMEKWKNYYIAEEDIAWAKSYRPDLECGAHYSLGGLIAHHRSGSLPTWMFGFTIPLNRCTAIPFIMADPDTGEVKSIALSNNFAGYELAPGEKIQTEDVMIGAFNNPHAGLEDWADRCAKRQNVKVWPKRPPVGWLSWYGYRLEQNEVDTLRTADLINEELAGLDFEYIQLDLGYNKGNLPGDWFETNENYSHGLKYLKEELSVKGFKLGVWVCPFSIAADSKFAKEHPEALLTHHPNDPDKWHWEPFCRMYHLDPTHPEGEKFLRRIVSHFKAIGVSYFKFDFCGRMARVDKDFTPYDRKAVRGGEVYRRGFEIIMDMMDDDDYVYWCSNLLHFGLGYGATSMACNDIGNTGFLLAREVEGRTEDINYFKRAATTVISRYFMHRKLLLLNPDSLNVAPPADMAECRLRATLVALSGGQFFLGDRFDLAEKDRLELIKQTCPPYGVAARPVDLFEHVYPDDSPHIWHLPVDTGWDRRDIVAIFNYDKAKTGQISLESFGLDKQKRYHLWDFWNQRYLGRPSDIFSYEFSRQDVLLMAIVSEREHPWILSTSFHFTQGGVELNDVKWDEANLELSGILNRPANMQGHLILHVPAQYKCSLEKAAENIYKYPLSGQGKNAAWKVKFN
jgi:Melibiase